MVDFEENGKQNWVFVSEKTGPFIGGFLKNTQRSCTGSFQFQSTIQASNRNSLQSRSKSGDWPEDINGTSPKVSAEKIYERDSWPSRYPANVMMSQSVDDFQCQHCRKSYFSLESLMIHTKTHRKKKKFQCTNRSHQRNHSVDLFNHLKTHQGSIIVFPRDKCNFEASNDKERTGHRDQVHKLGNYCGVLPAHAGSAIKAGQTPNVTEKPLPKCKGRIVMIPTAETTNWPNRLQKSASQVPIAPKTQIIEGNTLKNKSVRGLNGPKSVEMISEKLSAVQSQSNNRQKCDAPVMPSTVPNLSFPCPNCDEIFYSRRNLEGHGRIHRGEKLHRCTLCNYRSSQKNNMRRHLELHRYGKKLIICAICGYSVSSIAGLSSHYKNTHMDDSKARMELAAQKASQEIACKTDDDCEEDLQKATFFKSMLPEQYVEFIGEVQGKHEKIRAFPEQQVQKKDGRILGNNELPKLENKKIESHNLEVQTPCASPNKNSETKSPVPYKCEVCCFTCKFQIGLNKHVAKSHTEISPRVVTRPDKIPACQVLGRDEVAVIEKINDETYGQYQVAKLEQAHVDENEPEVNTWAVTKAPHLQETSPVSQGASPYACPNAKGSMDILKTLVRNHHNSAINWRRYSDLSSRDQMIAKFRTSQTHEIHFSSQSKSLQPPFKNPKNLNSMPIPASASSSNATSSMAPPASALTLQLLLITDLSSAKNSPTSVPSVLQRHISNNSTFPGQFDSTLTNSATTPGLGTPSFAPQASASPLQPITPQLLDNPSRSNGNTPPINFQPGFQPKASSHFHLKESNSPVGNTVPMKSKARTIPGYACGYCSRAFRQRNQLIRHTRIHTREKPYECNKCNFATSHQQSLVIHIRRHTGKRPYSCDICEHTTASLPALYIHRKRHSKPFKCRFCPRVSSNRPVIERHEKRHFIPAQKST